MKLADKFQEIVESLPGDWTDLELDLRLADEQDYVEAAVILSACNAQPYSASAWHWRLTCAHEFGHASPPEVTGNCLAKLDSEGIKGQLALRDVREGRVEAVNMWGRPESARQEFARRRAQ